MASKLALQICQRHLETVVTVGAKRLAANIDAELQEVRDVLGWAFAGPGSGGWTYAMHEPECAWQTGPDDSCNCRISRARALWAQMEVK